MPIWKDSAVPSPIDMQNWSAFCWSLEALLAPPVPVSMQPLPQTPAFGLAVKHALQIIERLKVFEVFGGLGGAGSGGGDGRRAASSARSAATSSWSCVILSSSGALNGQVELSLPSSFSVRVQPPIVSTAGESRQRARRGQSGARQRCDGCGSSPPAIRVGGLLDLWGRAGLPLAAARACTAGPKDQLKDCDVDRILHDCRVQLIGVQGSSTHQLIHVGNRRAACSQAAPHVNVKSVCELYRLEAIRSAPPCAR